MTVTNPFPAEYFARYDDTDDSIFYTHPRLTTHIDDRAINALSTHLKRILQPDGIYLDLMSSYRSHFPVALPVRRLVGLGLNAEEMRQNPQLDEFLLQDINHEPDLPFETGLFDGVVCTVSIQYLTRPVEVFAEVGRILKPGAPFVVSFSNRCFPSKAVRIWLSTSDSQHQELVKTYFTSSGMFAQLQVENMLPGRWLGDPLSIVTGYRVPDVL